MKIKNTLVIRKALELEDALNSQASGNLSNLTFAELALLNSIRKLIAENIEN